MESGNYVEFAEEGCAETALIIELSRESKNNQAFGQYGGYLQDLKKYA